MSQCLSQRRPARPDLTCQSWIARMLARMLVRRPRQISPDRLSDYLLRDAGLERVGGVVRGRAR